jgi:hypothetical protein
MNITSLKRNRTIARTLRPLDLELQDIPIDALNRIVYPFTFEITKDDFVDLMANSSRYSEILDINAKPKQVIFSESSDKGSSEIIFKKTDLVSLTFNEELLLNELEREKSENAKEEINRVIREKECVGSYSLSFLAVVKSFCNLLDLQDSINFSIKTDTPLKTVISFKKLSGTNLTYYLAPRVPEADFDEEGLSEDEEELNQDRTEL